MSRDAKTLLRILVTILPVCMALEILLDFPFAIGFGPFRLLPSGTTDRMNWCSGALFLVLILWVMLPRTSTQVRGKGVATWLSRIRRDQAARSLVAIILILAWLEGLQYFVSLKVASYRIHGSTTVLEKLASGLGPLGQRYLGDLEIPCIIESPEANESVINVLRENEAVAVLALNHAGLTIEKK